jgi:hypothetical protein
MPGGGSRKGCAVTTIVVAAITFAVGVLIGAFASAFGKTASDDD